MYIYNRSPTERKTVKVKAKVEILSINHFILKDGSLLEKFLAHYDQVFGEYKLQHLSLILWNLFI